jgi:spermidine synthase
LELLVFTNYNISPIAIVLFLVYAVSFALYKTKRIKVGTHRKVWNVLLLVTFLITGAFGLTMAIRRDYALLFSVPFNLIFWHVEAGVVMTVVSLFHLSWHLTYYRDLLKGDRKKARTGQ